MNKKYKNEWVMRSMLFSFLVLFLLVSILILEFALGKIGLGQPIIYEQNPAYGFTLMPDQKITRFRNAKIRVNSSGLRSDYEWQSNLYKILFHGDSVTYGGSYIDNSELFTQKVCDILGEGYRCGNAGINSYGVLNMVLRSRYDNRLNDADTIVFTVIKEDFLRGIAGADTAHYYLSEPNRWFPAIEELINFAGYKYDINRFLGKKSTRSKQTQKHARAGAIEFAIKNLNEELTRLKNKGKNVLVFYSPGKSETGVNPTEKNKGLIVQIKSNVKFLYDMTPHFSLKRDAIYYDAAHYEKAGHMIAAEVMAKVLSERITKKRNGH